MLDGKPSNFSEDDMSRRNTITTLLEQWGLLKVVRPEYIAELIVPISQIKIISHKEKHNWELVAKYNIGRRK